MGKFKNASQPLRGNAAAGIGDGNANGSGKDLKRQMDLSAGRRGLQRIGDQFHKKLLQHGAMQGDHTGSLFQPTAQLNAAQLSRLLAVLQNVGAKLRSVFIL